MLKQRKITLYIVMGLVIVSLLFYAWIKYSVDKYGIWPITNSCTQKTSFVASTGISSDGRYVITADYLHHLTLWDIKTKTRKILYCNANWNSAYWIKGTDNFVWQNETTDRVTVQNISGKVLKQFELPFLVRSEAISADLKYYVAYDGVKLYLYKNKQLVKLIRDEYRHKGNSLLMDALGRDSTPKFQFIGNDQLISSVYTIYKQPLEHEKIVTGTPIWDLANRKIIKNFIGTDGITLASLSPDNHYLVLWGDQDYTTSIWDVDSGKYLFTVADPENGILVSKNHSKDWHKWTRDTSKLIPPPCQSCYVDYTAVDNILFVDKQDYLIFSLSGYATLFNVKSPWAVKYLELKTEEATTEPLNNQYINSVASSPEAHIVVMAKNKPGILVYYYDPTDKTLKLLWDAE